MSTAPTSTRRTHRLWCALAIALLLPAVGATILRGQAPAGTSRSRDLEAEMNALKAQVQRFELQAPGTSSRNPDFDAMLNALKARLDRLESPPVAGGAASVDSQLAGLRRQLQQERESAQRLDTRLHTLAAMAVVICACVCALWAATSGRSSGAWFLAGLFFNVFALFAAIYQADRDRRRAPTSGEGRTSRPPDTPGASVG